MQKVWIGTLPRSLLGRWSVGLALASTVFFVLADVLSGFKVLGERNNHAFAVGLTIILAVIAGGAVATGLTSVVKSVERFVLVFLAAALGIYTLFGAITSLLALPE